MKKNLLVLAIAIPINIFSNVIFAAETGSEAIFKSNCSSCHPNGGNLMKPSKSLKSIKKPGRIIRKVRNGGGGMPSFDAKTISDTEVRHLADYIIKTFKK
ncbi:MAG: cytochrome c [Geobacteraceae bacterium]|nr:cytochrome c [Geobacteraceae bacterium]NTW80122.1 cytochrome c [Geobacteraceae bacterium]